MKNIIKLKFLPIVLIAFAMSLMLSCSNENRTEKYSDVLEEPIEPEPKETSSYNDSVILKHVASLLIEETSLGQLAQERFYNLDIKDLGEVMESEHQRILKDLNYLAEAKMIRLTDVLSLDSLKNFTILENKSGLEFDKEYCSIIIQKHLNVIDLLETAMNESEDPDIRDWASALIIEMRAHVAIARICEQRSNRVFENSGIDEISQHWDLAKTSF